MHVARNPPPALPTVTLQGVDLEWVKDFAYLGSKVADSGGATAEINRRTGIMAGAYEKFRKIFNKPNIRRSTKMKIFDAVVTSAAAYAAETWPAKKQDLSRLDCAHRRRIRRILKINWQDKVTNEIVHWRAQVPPLLETIRKRRLQWWGHIQRQPVDSLLGRYNDLEVAGRRRQGGQYMTWSKRVKQDFDHLGMSQEMAKDYAKSRTGWRSISGAGTRLQRPAAFGGRTQD